MGGRDRNFLSRLEVPRHPARSSEMQAESPIASTRSRPSGYTAIVFFLSQRSISTKPMYYPLNKREKILAAGLQLFAKCGFENTTVPQIKTNARVGLSTFYQYFRNKEELLNAIYRELRCKLEDCLDVPLHAGDAPRRQFHDLWIEMVSFDREFPSAIGFLEHRHHGAYLDNESKPLERVPWAIIDLVDRLGRENAIKNVPRMVLAAVAWGTFVELVKLDCQGHLTLSDEVLQAAEDCIWDAIHSPGDDGAGHPTRASSKSL
jgi:TetR/AcrR family transcriptional regulator, repressor of fatR-cypB operon